MNAGSYLIRCLITATLISGCMTARAVSTPAGDPQEGVIIAGLQMNVSDNIQANKSVIIEGIRQARAAGASFLVTPEGSLSGYTAGFNQQELAEALDEVRTAALKEKIGLILGTCFRKKAGGREVCYNQVRVYSPGGEFLGEYSKILRCSPLDLPGTGEMTDYVEGELKTFTWNGITFGTLICNDLWATPGYTTMPNPYLVWKLKQMGARFIIHCINSGTSQKYRPFHEASAELWASAARLPVMEVNAAHGNEMINARSGLIDADGERAVKVPDTGPQFFTVKIIPAAETADSGM